MIHERFKYFRDFIRFNSIIKYTPTSHHKYLNAFMQKKINYKMKIFSLYSAKIKFKRTLHKNAFTNTLSTRSYSLALFHSIEPSEL